MLRRVRVRTAVCGIALTSLLLAGDDSQKSRLDGYRADSSKSERAWENKFRSLPSPDLQREYMKRLSARPIMSVRPTTRKMRNGC